MKCSKELQEQFFQIAVNDTWEFHFEASSNDNVSLSVINTITLVIIFNKIEEVLSVLCALEHFSHLVNKLVRQLPLAKGFVKDVN